MFRILDNVPEVYAKQSRDFQTLAVLYDLAFQQVRFNIDSLTSVSSTKECQESVLQQNYIDIFLMHFHI